MKNDEEGNENIIILENLMHGFKYPSVMDIKLGFCTYCPDAK